MNDTLVELIFGPHCPFCNCRAWPYLHRCPAMRRKSAQQVAARVTAKVRDILKDAPADKDIHEAYHALAELEKAFEVTDHD